MQERNIHLVRYKPYILLGSWQQHAGRVLTTGTGIAKTNKAYLWGPAPWQALSLPLASHPFLWAGQRGRLRDFHIPESAQISSQSYKSYILGQGCCLPIAGLWVASSVTQLKKMWSVLFSTVKISVESRYPPQIYLGGQNNPPPKSGRKLQIPL